MPPPLNEVMKIGSNSSSQSLHYNHSLDYNQSRVILPMQFTLAAFGSISALVTVILNFLFFIVMTRYLRLQTSFSIYALNLSIADVLSAVFNMMGYIAVTIRGEWPFGVNFCHFYSHVRITNFSASEHAMVLIAIDKLWSLWYPLNYRRHRSIKLSCIVCCLTWLYLNVVLIPYVVLDRVFYSQTSSPKVCYFNVDAQRTYSLILCIFLWIVPLMVLLCCYFAIHFRLRRRRLFSIHRINVVVAVAESSGTAAQITDYCAARDYQARNPS